MGFSIKKLQVAILAGAGLLLLVTLSFVAYSRYVARGFKLKLPGKLGIDIQRQSDGFTYSQSVQGKTIYTIHAAKAIQHNNGKWTLHDVGINLYGQKQDRADHIYGSDFEYDQKAGQISAAGEVQIDLAAAPSATRVNSGRQNDHVIHLKTSGLSFDDKSHRAVTTQRIDFTSGAYSGHAIGADYNSDSGMIVLNSQVAMNGAMDEKPMVLNAAHAEINQKTNLIDLVLPHLLSVSEDNGEQSVTAQHAVIHTDQDNNPDRMQAQGEVTLSGTTRGTLTSDFADALLHGGRAQSAHLYGHVRYNEVDDLRNASGEANDARIEFDSLGRESHALLAGDVYGREQVSAVVRELHAARVEIAFAAQGREPSVLKQMQASTGTRLHMVETAASKTKKTPVQTVSDLSADVLTAEFTPVGRTARLVSVHGTGSTLLHRVDAQGADTTSSGDVVDASFIPAVPKPGSKVASASAVQMQRAVQQGSVTVLRTPVARPGTPATTQHAAANEATYDADADTLTLAGDAKVSDPASSVMAGRITMLHESGDATAEGDVRATYLQATQGTALASSQATPAEPVHVLSDHAVMHRDDGVALFYGKPARLWQAGTQVEAPILELDQNKHTLFAHGETGASGDVVHAVLVSAPKQGAAAPSVPPRAKPGVGSSSSPIRIASHELTYADSTRQIGLHGNVLVEDADGTMRAAQATVFLLPVKNPPPRNTAAAVAIPGGQIDHIVATGYIRMQQPGRTATGQQLVYTASDGVAVLTGTPAAPPKAVDDVQGTITGDSLRFTSGENSIVVTGAGATRRVHTVTSVKQ